MKAAIIGCGLIGQKRANALPDSVELVGCFDEVRPNAESFAKEFNTQFFTSVEELLKIEDLDFVIIATRHDSLAQLTVQALSVGVNVFVEKPGAINYQAFQKTYEMAKQNNLRVHVGYNHQYHPGIRKALDFFRDGSIGEFMFLRSQYGHGGRAGYEKEWRADKSKSGGGELIDQGTHLIDLALNYLGNAQLDYAATPNYFWDMPVEDNAFISLKNDAGNIAFLQASCTEWKNMFSLEIYGKTGKLHISGLGRSYGVETLTLHEMLPEMGPPISQTWTFPEPDNSWALEINEFIEDLVTGSRKSDNLDSSLEVLRVIKEIYSRTSR
jgi:predicted dehydrogenase